MCDTGRVRLWDTCCLEQFCIWIELLPEHQTFELPMHQMYRTPKGEMIDSTDWRYLMTKSFHSKLAMG